MSDEEERSILVVEDERIVARDIQDTLSSMGYDAFAVAASADEAVARATERCPDLVLMDIRIRGDRDGVETAELFRRRFDVPVVYLTAHVDDATLERAKRTEPYGYLLKPINAAKLRSVLEMAFYKHDMDRQLRERERWFSTTLHSIADAVVTVDRAGSITYMNPAAERLTGVTLSAATGRPAREVLPFTESGRDLSPLDDALDRQEVVNVVEATLGSGGAPARTVSDSAAPVLDGERMVGAVMVFRDVTEQQRLRTQMDQSLRLASLGTMAAGMAHEVNNPLAVVIANARFVSEGLHLVLDKTTGATAASCSEMLVALSELSSAASRIERIVSDLKTLTRPPAPETGSADVGRALQWATRAVLHEIRQRATLVVDLPPLRPVALDEHRLGQVLVNLLLNAAHAIAPGALERNRIAVTAADEPGGIRLSVSDTGSGMSRETLARLFEPFYTTKPVGAGTGLGLSICHGIVTAAGGRIEVRSDPGWGTEVSLYLPAAQPAPAGTASADEPAAAVAPRRARILVVDDEELILRVIERVLDGHEVVGVQRAVDALRMIEAGRTFDIVFTDVSMPEMTGMAFHDALSRIAPEQASRVVFITGGATSPYIADYLERSAQPCVEKPFGVEALRASIQLWLAEWGSAPGGSSAH